jgi:type I restriction enzyme S subunit
MACDLINGGVDQINSKFISEKLAKSLRIGFAKNEDVLLSHKGTIGRVAILETDKPFVILTPQITYYRILDKSKIYNKFLYYYFLSNRFQSEMQKIAGKGSTRAYIGITKQEELSLLVPSLTEQKQIVKKLDQLSEKTQKLETLYKQKIESIKELKKSILSQVFSKGI